MSDNIKTTLYILLALITLSGAVWGAASHLQKFVERIEFKEKCNEWNGNFEALRSELHLNLAQQRMAWLQQQIIALESQFGPNCQNAPPSVKRTYYDYKQEYINLQQKVQMIMNRGGG